MMERVPRFPVFIVGSPRSGTSVLVDALLTAGYVGYREGAFFPLLTLIDRAIERQYAAHGDATKRNMLSDIDKQSLKQKIFSVMATIATEKNCAGPWLDKTGSAEMVLAVPTLMVLWPDSVFLFAKRRGLENVESRLRKFPNHTFEHHCSEWARTMASWRGMRAIVPKERRAEIDQLDIALNPEGIAKELQSFLGLNLAASNLLVDAFRSRRPQRTLAADAPEISPSANRNWNSQQIDVFQSICAREMMAYGYSFNDTYWSKPVKTSSP